MPAAGLFLATVAALCSAAAAVLQAISTGRVQQRYGSLARLLYEPTYVVALLAIAGGFVASFAALHILPVFVVQAVRAASLALTAVIVAAMGVRLARIEWLALAVTTAGLVAVGTSARSAVAVAAPWLGWVLCLGVVLVAAAGLVALRRGGPRAGVGLALAAGLGFALLATGAHVVTLSFPGVLAQPAAWAGGGGGLLGLVFGALAYARAGVVVVTGTIVATETLMGSALGIILTGDRPLAGRELVAALGFAAALGGALALARFGTVKLPEVAPRQLER